MMRRSHDSLLLVIAAALATSAWLTLGLSLGPQNATAVQRLAAPVYGYRVVNAFSNDPQAFSQGPLYTDAVFESGHLPTQT